MSIEPNCLKIMKLTGGTSTNSQFIYGTKSKTAPGSRGNGECGNWKKSQTRMLLSPILFNLYGEYLMKEALAEVSALGGGLITRQEVRIIRLL